MTTDGGARDPEEIELGPVGRLVRNPWIASVVAAVLLCVSFAPASLGWLTAPLGWGVLLLSIRLRNGERAGRQAFVTGFLFTLAAFSWLMPLNLPMWIFVSAWCAMFDGLFGWLVGRYLSGAQLARASYWFFAAPAFRVFADLLLGLVMTGFPWFLTGYTQVDNPVLLGSADLFGVHGVTFAVILLAGGLAESGARTLQYTAFRLAPIGWAIGHFALLAAWTGATGSLELHSGPRVALLQASISQKLKEDREAAGEAFPTRAEWLGRHTELITQAWAQTQAAGGTLDVVVWPETMYPDLAFRPPDDPRNRTLWLEAAGHSRGAYTLLGIPSRFDENDRRNSVFALTPRGEVLGVQDKQHLTPGGEYLPLVGMLPFRDEFEAWVRGWAGFLPDLRPGEGPVLLPVGQGARQERVGVLICYESIFPELSREMVNEGAGFLLNASNYGWFAETAMMDQSLAMARFRAAEVRRSFVLSSNNGISAVIGPRGEILDVLEDAEGRRTDVPGVLVADVPICAESSPYAGWGDVPAWVISGLGLLWLVLARRRPSQIDQR